MKWKNEVRKLEDLIPNHRNPRRITKRMVEKLKESLGEFDLCSPLIINVDGKLIGGHQRAKVLMTIGWTEVETRVPDRKLTQKECDKLNLMLNKINGDWNDDIMANEWEDEELLDGGFTEEEVCIDIPIEGEEKGKMSNITINFANSKHLKEAEDAIGTIVDIYDGATYKVKIK